MLKLYDLLKIYSRGLAFVYLMMFFLCGIGHKTSLNTQHYFIHRNETTLGFFNKNFWCPSIYHPPSPIFWTGHVEVDRGLTALYERTIFHTKKYFSVNVGASFSWWQLGWQNQFALSGFLELRFWLFRTSKLSPYVIWSIAGPTLLSRRKLGSAHLGERFIFQDFLGVGLLVGRQHQFDISARLYHYSNGDIFPINQGFDVPIVLLLGYLF